jgi:coproporphyrinogen III oxidase-like Fe-S oxidoreductase
MTKENRKIANFTIQDLENYVNLVQGSNLPSSDKSAIAEVLTFVEKLIEMLRSSKISIHRLKKLMGFHSELLKKLQQTQD